MISHINESQPPIYLIFAEIFVSDLTFNSDKNFDNLTFPLKQISFRNISTEAY